MFDCKSMFFFAKFQANESRKTITYMKSEKAGYNVAEIREKNIKTFDNRLGSAYVNGIIAVIIMQLDSIWMSRSWMKNDENGMLFTDFFVIDKYTEK